MGKKKAEEKGKGGTDWPPVPPPLPFRSLGTSANNKIWKEYLTAEGLVSEEMLIRDIHHFALKASGAKNYRNNLSKNLSQLEDYIVEGFDLQAATVTASQSASVKANIPEFETNNEPTLKMLSGRNCYVHDGTDKRYVLQFHKGFSFQCQ